MLKQRKVLLKKLFTLRGKNIKKVRENIITDQISKDKEGNHVLRQSYFYRPKESSGEYAARMHEEVKKHYPEAKLVDSGDHFANFKGDAPLSKQSHYYAKIKLHDEAEKLRMAGQGSHDPNYQNSKKNK